MEDWRLIRACFSSVTLDVRALTMEVNPMLGAEAMADMGSGELGEEVSSTWRLLGVPLEAGPRREAPLTRGWRPAQSLRGSSCPEIGATQGRGQRRIRELDEHWPLAEAGLLRQDRPGAYLVQSGVLNVEDEGQSVLTDL